MSSPGPFLSAHATHPDARMALALAAAQIDAQRAQRPGFDATLGLLYLSDRCRAQAAEVLDEARLRWPGVHWSGCVAVGVCASGVEYFDEPALSLLLTDLPREHFQRVHGRHPLPHDSAWTALVHADPETPELRELLPELAERTGAHYLFGGVSSARQGALQFADAVVAGGLSGVGFGPEVGMVSRVTQGCQPVGRTRTVTAAERNVVTELDGAPALPQLLGDLGLSLDRPRETLSVLRETLVGLTDEGDEARGQGGQFGVDTRVRHLIGLDPARDALAVAEPLAPGMQLALCTRHAEAARRDLVRVCTEIREEIESDDSGQPAREMVGALYVSCTGRGGPHFGGPSAELQIIQQALGELPLTGFFAGGEIAHHHLYGYTGVLTVFVKERASA